MKLILILLTLLIADFSLAETIDHCPDGLNPTLQVSEKTPLSCYTEFINQRPQVVCQQASFRSTQKGQHVEYLGSEKFNENSEIYVPNLKGKDLVQDGYYKMQFPRNTIMHRVRVNGRVLYIRARNNDGEETISNWICRSEKLKALQPDSEHVHDENCHPNRSAIEEIADLRDLENHIEKSESDNTEVTYASLLHEHIGQCLFDEKDEDNVRVITKIKSPGNWRNDRNVFNQTMIPHWEAQKSKLPLKDKSGSEILDPNGDSITIDKLVAIDTLARTLFGEMNKCSGETIDSEDGKAFGDDYIYAVAAVLVNRANAMDNIEAHGRREVTRFVNNKVRSDIADHSITRVSMANDQFNAWNKYTDSSRRYPNVGPLSQTLCPPKTTEAFNSCNDKVQNQTLKPYWKFPDRKGARATCEELSAWQASLRVATEAVLNPGSFNFKTRDIKSFYYTSKVDFYPGWIESNPVVYSSQTGQKRVLKNDDCLRFWKPNSESKSKRARIEGQAFDKLEEHTQVYKLSTSVSGMSRP